MTRESTKTIIMGLACIVIMLMMLWMWNNASNIKTHNSAISGHSNISPVHFAIRWLLPQNTYMYDCTKSASFNTSYSSNFLKLQSHHDDHWTKVKMSMVGVIIEGHRGAAFKFPQYRFYYRLAQEPWVTNICEVGFNAGHSAMLWLGASPNHVRLHSFDRCRHKYTPPMAEFVKGLFADRFNVACGDSDQTVPAAVHHLRDKCDLVIIDGGHSYEVALADLRNFEPLANPEHHMVVIDDIPNMPSVGRAWEQAKADTLITEIVACETFDNEYNDTKGFITGVYSNKYHI